MVTAVILRTSMAACKSLLLPPFTYSLFPNAFISTLPLMPPTLPELVYCHPRLLVGNESNPMRAPYCATHVVLA